VSNENESPDDWKKKVQKGTSKRVTKGKSMGNGNDNDRYVVPNKDRGGWDVKKENAQRSSAHLPTKKAAEARAKEIVEKSGKGDGEVRSQNLKGKWSDSDSGSKNESPRKDTKH
jgi:hypothetical protein